MTPVVERRLSDGTFVGRGADDEVRGRWHPDEVAPGLSLTQWERWTYISHDGDGTYLIRWWSLRPSEGLEAAREWLAEHRVSLRELDWTRTAAEIGADPAYRAWLLAHPSPDPRIAERLLEEADRKREQRRRRRAS